MLDEAYSADTAGNRDSTCLRLSELVCYPTNSQEEESLPVEVATAYFSFGDRESIPSGMCWFRFLSEAFLEFIF